MYSFIYILAQPCLQHHSWCCIFLDTCSGDGLCLYQVLLIMVSNNQTCLQNNILNFLTRWVCDKQDDSETMMTRWVCDKMTVWQVTGWLCDKTSAWKYEFVTKMIVRQRWEDDSETKMNKWHDKMSVWPYKRVSGPCKCQNESQGMLRHHRSTFRYNALHTGIACDQCVCIFQQPSVAIV